MCQCVHGSNGLGKRSFSSAFQSWPFSKGQPFKQFVFRVLNVFDDPGCLESAPPDLDDVGKAERSW